jgi:ribosomal protein S18 acetylase RimI-like enzyme
MTADPESGRLVGTMWLLDLKQQTPNDVAVTPGTVVTFQRAGSETATLVAEAMGLDDPAPVLERFAAGRSCYVGWVDGAIATYGWVSIGKEWISELGLHFELASDDAYIWDCGTLPAYRGRGLYPALLRHIALQLHTEGLHRVWIGADTENVASQKGFMRSGFSPIADVFLAPAPGPNRFYMQGRDGVPGGLVEYIRRALAL